MKIRLDDRAEIALNSLDTKTKRRVFIILSQMSDVDRLDFSRLPFIARIRQFTDRPMWVARVNQRIRLIVSLDDEGLVIEDVVPADRLNRVTGRPRA